MSRPASINYSSPGTYAIGVLPAYDDISDMNAREAALVAVCEFADLFNEAASAAPADADLITFWDVTGSVFQTMTWATITGLSSSAQAAAEATAAGALAGHVADLDPHAQYQKEEAGKGLSTNDFDDAAEIKLGGIEAAADVTDEANVTAIANATAEVAAAPDHILVLVGGALKRWTKAGFEAVVKALFLATVEAGAETATPADADVFPSVSAAHAAQKSTWAQVKAALAIAFKHGGSNELGTATPAANALSKANASGKLDAWISDATTAVKGIMMLATRGVESAAKAVPAVGADVAALLAAGGYLTEFDGVTWDESTDTYTTFGRASTHPNYLKVQKGMRRCVVTDAGVVAYYLHPTNSALKEDGVTASVLDGTDGQVMVEIPKFYYSYSYVGTLHTWKISEYQLPGFELHPMFLQGTTEMSKAFIGAYEASYYDVSASKASGGAGVLSQAVSFVALTKTITSTASTAPFKNCVIGSKMVITGTTLNNATVTVATVSDQSITIDEVITDETAASASVLPQVDTTATTGDKLSSVSGLAPLTYKTRAGFRQLAKNRGAGWTQQTYDMAFAVQILILVEYGSFYSQNKIGAGITNVSNWLAYNNYFPIAKAGNSNAIGNVTGNNAGATAAATEESKYLSYRGIENFFGHVWKWVDGFNINANAAYVNNTIATMADDTASGYTLLGSMPAANGYISTLLAITRGFLPKAVGSPADGSHKITDYYYQSTAWRVASLGGSSADGANAGAWSWYCNASSAYADQDFGARVGLLKQ